LGQPVTTIGNFTVTAGHLLAAAAVLLALLILAWIVARSARGRAEAARRAEEAEARLAEIARAQAEMQGRMATIAEIFSTRQSDLNRAIGERLDSMTNRLSNSLVEQTRSTHENLARLQERLAVID